MTQQELSVFETTLQKTNDILRAVQGRLGWSDRSKAYLALRVVLHILRNRLPVEQAVAFSAQLPMLVRGFYFEGWRPSLTPVKIKKEEFIEIVRRDLDLPINQDAEEVVKSVLSTIEAHIDPAEMRKIEKLMPKSMAEIFSE